MSKSSQFLSLLLVCEGFPLSNRRLLSYRSGKACTQILQLGQSTSSLSHCFPEPCEPSDPAFQTVYSWCPSSSAFIFLISLPFSIFPQIRKVPPYSEIWHKSLKFQRAITLSTKSFFFFFGSSPLISDLAAWGETSHQAMRGTSSALTCSGRCFQTGWVCGKACWGLQSGHSLGWRPPPPHAWWRWSSPWWVRVPPCSRECPVPVDICQIQNFYPLLVNLNLCYLYKSKKVLDLTWWMLSFLWSTAPPPGPWACCQSQHLPDLESGSHGNRSIAPTAAASSGTETSAPLSQCGPPQAPSSHSFSPSVTWRSTNELLQTSSKKSVSALPLVCISGSRSQEKPSGVSCIYVKSSFSLVLEISSAYTSKKDSTQF